MKNPHDVVKCMLRTEKGSVMMALNKYVFWVETSANKIEVKKAVEEMYKVKVSAVNTMIASGKPKRVRYALGKTSEWKKAIVTLSEGSKIDVT